MRPIILIRALAGLGGLAASVALYGQLDPLAAAAVVIVSLYVAPFRRRVVGDAEIRPLDDIDAKAVRRYREAHPGTTITEAIAALQR